MNPSPPHPHHRSAAVVAGLLLTLVLASDARAFALRYTTRGDVVAWSLARGPIEVHAESSGLSAEGAELLERAVEGAVDAWNGHSALSLVYAEGVGPTSGAIIVRWDTRPWDSSQEQLAVAALAYDESTGDVKGAQVRINDAFLWGHADVGDDRTARFIGYDLQSTVTHELGHAVGLAHSDVEAATMHLGATTGESAKRSLDLDDVLGLRALYGVEGSVEARDVGGCQDVEAPHGHEPRTVLGLLAGLALALWGRAQRTTRRAASTSPR